MRTFLKKSVFTQFSDGQPKEEENSWKLSSNCLQPCAPARSVLLYTSYGYDKYINKPGSGFPQRQTQTDRHTTHGHRDLETESAHRADSVKIY